jgi:hypothetical protein
MKRKPFYLFVLLTTCCLQHSQAQFLKKLKDKVNKAVSKDDAAQKSGSPESTGAINADGRNWDDFTKIDFAKLKIETKTVWDKGDSYEFGYYRSNMPASLYLPLNEDGTPQLIPYYPDAEMGKTGDMNDDAIIFVQQNDHAERKMSLADFNVLSQPIIEKEKTHLEGLTLGITETDQKLVSISTSIPGGAFEFIVGGKKYSFYRISALRTDDEHQRFFALVSPSMTDYKIRLASSGGGSLQLPSITYNQLRVNEEVTNACVYAATMKGLVFADGKTLNDYDNNLIPQSWMSPLGDNVFGINSSSETCLNGKKISSLSATPGYGWSNQDGSVWAFLCKGETNVGMSSDDFDQKLVFSDGVTLSGNIGRPRLITLNKKLYLSWLMFSLFSNKILVCYKEM